MNEYISIKIICEKECDNDQTDVRVFKKINDNFEYKKMPELLNLRYKDFLKYYKNFKLITSEEGLDYLNSL